MNLIYIFVVQELLQQKASANLEGEELNHDLNELNEHYNELVYSLGLQPEITLEQLEHKLANLQII